jgi:FixJ family two-component response regulator
VRAETTSSTTVQLVCARAGALHSRLLTEATNGGKMAHAVGSDRDSIRTMPYVSDRKPIVALIDDDELLLKLLSSVLTTAGLSSQPHTSPHSFLSSYDPDQPGCLISDITMPGMTGLDLQQHLNLLGAVSPVIFLTGNADVSIAVEAMRHGAFEFLEKPVANQLLVETVRRAIEFDATNRLQLAQLERIRTRFESLTQREHDVYRLVAEGLANKQIAAELNIAGRTVELHRSRVMEKMNVRSLAQLLRMKIELEKHHRKM